MKKRILSSVEQVPMTGRFTNATYIYELIEISKPTKQSHWSYIESHRRRQRPTIAERRAEELAKLLGL